MNQIELYLPAIAFVVVTLVGGIVLHTQGKLKQFAREAVAGAYRVGLHAAAALAAEGIDWLRSDAGIEFRKTLAGNAYDALPATVGVVPVGLVKVYLSRERWCRLVEDAFQRITVLADALELPEELPLG